MAYQRIRRLFDLTDDGRIGAYVFGVERSVADPYLDVLTRRLWGCPLDHDEFLLLATFKAHKVLSPYQWVIDRRLNRTESLLRQSKMGVAEIAYAAGFSSQSHMTTLFFPALRHRARRIPKGALSHRPAQPGI